MDTKPVSIQQNILVSELTTLEPDLILTVPLAGLLFLIVSLDVPLGFRLSCSPRCRASVVFRYSGFGMPHSNYRVEFSSPQGAYALRREH